jgi:Beta-galactosidase
MIKKFSPCLVAVLVATALSSAHVSAATTQHQCFAYTAAGSPKSMIAHAQALSSSPCAGISWTFPWNEIEPANGSYNWSFIDDALAASGSKPVILRVNPGLTSPAWVPRADGIVIPDPKGGSGWMPIPWNADFLAIWKTFINAYGARYNANPHIAMIEGNGDGPQGEAHLTGTYTQWQAVGYSEQVYVNAIATEISDFKVAFPSHKVSFAGATPPTGAPSTPNLLQGFISACEQANIVIQNNGLTGTKYGHINQTVIEFGYQTAGSLGTGLGAALRMATSLGASFVEVYYVDATNTANYSAVSTFQV